MNYGDGDGSYDDEDFPVRAGRHQLTIAIVFNYSALPEVWQVILDEIGVHRPIIIVGDSTNRDSLFDCRNLLRELPNGYSIPVIEIRDTPEDLTATFCAKKMEPLRKIRAK